MNFAYIGIASLRATSVALSRNCREQDDPSCIDHRLEWTHSFPRHSPSLHGLVPLFLIGRASGYRLQERLIGVEGIREYRLLLGDALVVRGRRCLDNVFIEAVIGSSNERPITSRFRDVCQIETRTPDIDFFGFVDLPFYFP